MESSETESDCAEVKKEHQEDEEEVEADNRSMTDLFKIYGLNSMSIELQRAAAAQNRPDLLENLAMHRNSAPVHPQEELFNIFAHRFGTASSLPDFPAPPPPVSEPEDDSSQVNHQLLKKFDSAAHCMERDCIVQQLREHYHCQDRYCISFLDGREPHFLKTFVKKEEIIRHLKWHKKRTETLKFGFLRFSCMDDCRLNNIPSCQFNGKQTHYHCIEEGCDKVYISTSDVQMHANYHRKTNAIKKQGFLRVRNLENCLENDCPYANQQTTHFHCLREGCQFTFKNKGEMEKHKIFHLRDEQLLNHGFKKFFKNERCNYAKCRYDEKLNHIHCVRPNCNYVFHSSGQLMSHKRKHEKYGDNLLPRDRGGTPDQSPGPSTAHFPNSMNLAQFRDRNFPIELQNRLSLPLNLSEDSPNFNQPQCLKVTNGGEPSTPHLPVQVTSKPSLVGERDKNDVLQITSIDGLFNRKRGRPPKNRFVEVYNSTEMPSENSIAKRLPSQESPQAIFTSFKLEKTNNLAKEDPEEQSRVKKKPKIELPPEEPVTPTSSNNLVKSTGIFYPYDLSKEATDHPVSDSESSEQTSPTEESPLMINPYLKPQDEASDRPAENPVQNTLDWFKFAYQQNNPFMVFATTAAILAASMNPATNPKQQINPAFLEYAKNLFYNNPESPMTMPKMKEEFPNRGGIDENDDSCDDSTAASNDFSYLSEGLDLSRETKINKRNSENRLSNFGSREESIPLGYVKFRFNEDCQFPNCGYRNHQSHFHCLRDNCYYSFCDKTRFVQHTARHERLDKLMGNEFKQFRSNMNCGYKNCTYSKKVEDESQTGGTSAKNQSKSSHFHCQKCDYICTDTNKVVAHRRQHNKIEYIQSTGFRKVSSSEVCFNSPPPQTMEEQTMIERDQASLGHPSKCHYSGKQTHYHCLVCNSVVLNRSQLAVHRHKSHSKAFETHQFD